MHKENLPNIRCPKCKRNQDSGFSSNIQSPSWVCDNCSWNFDTFAFHGICPKCKHKHKETTCLTCGEVSNHLDFYPESYCNNEESRSNEIVKEDILTQEKYKCPQCNSIDFLKLSQNNKSEYIYECINENRICNFNLNTYITKSHKFLSLDVSYGGQLWEGNHHRCNNDFNSHLNTECLECINSLKICMLPFLTHFHSCTWGACYNTMFSNVIKPYFDDIEILKFFLKQDRFFKPATFRNKNGYLMYSELGSYLKRINCSQLQDFLRTEFGFYNDDFLYPIK